MPVYMVLELLSQIDNGEEKVIAFASKTLKGAEAHYSVIEREALALTWAIKHFKFCLWGYAVCGPL